MQTSFNSLKSCDDSKSVGVQRRQFQTCPCISMNAAADTKRLTSHNEGT